MLNSELAPKPIHSEQPRSVLDEYWHHLDHLDWYASDTSDIMHQTMVDVGDGMSLCVEAGGDPTNPPIIMIIGFGSQLIFWTESFVKGLIKAGFFVIRFDNRDIGLSSKMPQKTLPAINLYNTVLRSSAGLSNDHLAVTYNLFDMVEDTVTLIQKLRFKKVYVLGASMGGMIAQVLAARYPHLVERLALLFSSSNRAFLAPPKPKQLKMLLSKPKSYQKSDVLAYSNEFINTIGSPGFIDPILVKKLAAMRFTRSFYPLGSARQLQAIIATGAIDDYTRAIAAPTLVLHGTQDKLLPPANGQAVANIIPNSYFVKIEGMGHDIPAYFEPFIINHLTRFFLNPSQ